MPSLPSDDVIVTSSETTFTYRRRKRYHNILSNITLEN